MKILYLITKPEEGGAQEYINYLANHFKKKYQIVRGSVCYFSSFCNYYSWLVGNILFN